MPVFKKRNLVKGLTVKEAMQRQVVQLPATTPIRQCIRHIIKFKANAVMVTDPHDKPQGVVSKTDIMGAFYAELPVDTRISDIMVGPPYVCSTEDYLETVIDQMQTLGIHQIYVQSMTNKDIEGQMAYSDIVGLLYRYCRRCVKSGRCAKMFAEKGIPRLIAADVMTSNVTSCDAARTITEVIEILSEMKLGAILVTNKGDSSLGIVSKTDLLLAYIQGARLDEPAQTIMNSPVTRCNAGIRLSDAIQQLLLYDIQRIFLPNENNGQVIGVLSLSDATRFRSGTCRACGAGRILGNFLSYSD